MNDQTTKPSSTRGLRCRHYTVRGRRCRLPVTDAASGLCFRHAVRQQKDREPADFAATLTGKSEEFQTAMGINNSLGELYRLLAEDKIAPRRAAVLAYISNLLLRTLPAIDHENNFQSDESGEDIAAAILRNAPRPIRDDPPVVS
ncbi:MAG TPA: hypothetical protein VHF01_00670 [Candidatus Acidoferrum sp.]|nr:hypothetical protein [Candidatus Acidoferrum sp.]